MILFGGATGDTGKYIITGDTYCLDLISNKWSKLEGKIIVSLTSIKDRELRRHRGQHTGVVQLTHCRWSFTVEPQEVSRVIIGHSLGGSLASDDLYLLDLRNGEAAAQWMIVPVVGKTPGRRYGHTIVFSKPFLLVFGGNTGTEPVNDVWCLNVDKAPFSWQALEIVSTDLPPVRAYHSSALCTTGSATGMMVTFGGRTAD